MEATIESGMYLFTKSAVFNIVQNAFDPPPPPLRFEHLLDFFDGLGATLHSSKNGQLKA